MYIRIILSVKSMDSSNYSVIFIDICFLIMISLSFVRRFSCSGYNLAKTFRPFPEYKLKCGLELHTQLKTKHKLFSLTPTSQLLDKPNSKVSYFDCGLPGTQPQLNPEALLLALKAAVALDSDIQTISSFDRKHYFYPDQPLGYQITQFYKPIAKGGQVLLEEPFDDINEKVSKTCDGTKVIRIQQVQIEQDTGRTIYNDDTKDIIQLDLNRANTPLIELVTLPDFENIYQVRSFIKKYQQLVKYLDICTGELETGAIRVDVNVSVAGGNRVELKNLRNTSDIIQAIEYEYFRQVELLKLGAPVQQETRGWNGSETVLQRSKEAAVDYRYFPDSELPFIRLSSEIKQQISNELPKFPTDIARELMSNPYNLELKHAKFLIDNKELLDYYTTLYESLIEGGIQGKFASNWIFNNLLATFKKLNKPVSLELVPVEEFKSLIKAVVSKEISKNDGNKILIRAIQENGGSLSDMIKEIAAIQPETLSSDEIVTKVISENPETVEKIKSGNLNSIKFLIGMAMKKSSGRGNSKEFEQKLKNLLDIQ